jgi:zinc protease
LEGLKRAGVTGLTLLLLLIYCTNAFALSYSETLLQNSPFVLPIVKRDSLLNGLQLITLEQPGTGAVSTHLRINCGALFDLAGKAGLADVTAGMLLRGGGGLNAKSIATTVEQAGITVNVSVGWDSTDITINGPSDSLETIFDLFGKLLITPSFDQKELDSLRAERIAILAEQQRDPSTVVRRKSLELLYGPYPFGRPARGTTETLTQITRQDLLYFHTRFYLANNSELVVAGEATADQVTRLARSKLGAWKKSERVPATFRSTETPSSRRISVNDRGLDQPSRAAIAQMGFSRRADDYLAAVVMLDLLGQEFSSVAPHESAIKVDFEGNTLAGPIVVGITSSPTDLTTTVNAILDVMSNARKIAPTVEKVEAAKARLISGMAERLKTTEGAANVILDIETYGLGRDYVVHFAERVNAIAPADVLHAAQTYLKPETITIAVSGPVNSFESALKKLGKVTVEK